MAPKTTAEIEAYARSLSRTDRTLLAVRDELYAGSWEELEHDLRARLHGKPYIFKLATKIEEDLERIARLREFEERHGVDLRKVLRNIGIEAGGVDTDPASAGRR